MVASLPPDAESLRQFFHDFLAERGVDIEEEKLLKFHFTDSGLLDSFEILSMIMQLEAKFALQFSPDELADSEIATVQGLLRAALRKTKLAEDAPREYCDKLFKP